MLVGVSFVLMHVAFHRWDGWAALWELPVCSFVCILRHSSPWHPGFSLAVELVNSLPLVRLSPFRTITGRVRIQTSLDCLRDRKTWVPFDADPSDCRIRRMFCESESVGELPVNLNSTICPSCQLAPQACILVDARGVCWMSLLIPYCYHNAFE